MKREIDLTFITPLFSHGATDIPEIRAASIRGMLHHWFRIVGGTIEAERRIFGGIKQGKARFTGHDETHASKLVVRVSNVKGGTKELLTLPHKTGGYASPRKAFERGVSCRVVMSDRLGGLAKEDEELLNRTINAWLLMGTLGYRSTRAAGSFKWVDESFPMPKTPEEYQEKCLEILGNTNSKVAVLGKVYNDSEIARRDVSDSLSIEEYNYPLGKVRGGRKTSPLRYRIVQFEKNYQIVAFWDGREEVTGNDESDFKGAVRLLKQGKGNKIGLQLVEAFNVF
jgi:CRISPR type III-B/RAMP module RAMP protein Cmr1